MIHHLQERVSNIVMLLYSSEEIYTLWASTRLYDNVDSMQFSAILILQYNIYSKKDN